MLYRFWSGDPMMIYVGPREAGDVVTEEVFADAPELLPEWLLEELQWEGHGAKDGLL